MARLGAWGSLWRCAALAALLTVAISFCMLGLTDSAELGVPKPAVSPDRIEDATTNDRGAVADFAWRAFIALSWPSRLEAAGRGSPDRRRALGDSGPRVWETFKSDFELFEIGDDGRRVPPTIWASYDGRYPCGAGVDNRKKTIASFDPFTDFNQPSFMVGAPANPLIAQNGGYTRYEIHFNEPEFTAFAANGWSQGRNLPDEGHPAHLPIGSIAVKAAWRPLIAADSNAVHRRYYVERAEIVDPAKTVAAGRVICSESDVALVGLHIAIKTKSRPQWIWSTFEHVDNVPPAGAGEAHEPDAMDTGAPYSYFDSSRPARLWPPFGSPGALPVDWKNPPKPNPTPMQVLRRHPIDPAIMTVNRTYWSLPGVKGTVWERYMLVGVQWPTSHAPPGPDNDGASFPGEPDAGNGQEESYKSTAKDEENLVNTTMETYLQDRPSSCMACHQAVSNAKGDDFVGTLAGIRQ
jgi:hypothetical protein